MCLILPAPILLLIPIAALASDLITMSFVYSITMSDAKDLIRWCLKGNPQERPSLHEVLGHRFLTPEAPPPRNWPMIYHAFMSHAQADASGTVGTLFFAYKQLGLHNWLDMRQDQLTLEGMRNGVRSSQLFLLVLSERVLSSWFCQQELLCAIELGVDIQLLLEEEPRFHPFNYSAWNSSQGSNLRSSRFKTSSVCFGVCSRNNCLVTSRINVRRMTAICIAGSDTRNISIVGSNGKIIEKLVKVSKDTAHPWQANQTNEQLTKTLYSTIDMCLPHAITYRRRDFEQEAMMQALCARNGIILPCDNQLPDQEASNSHIHVFVVYNRRTASVMLEELSLALEASNRVILTRSVDPKPSQLASAQRVLLLLSKGVLTSPSVDQLEYALMLDRQHRNNRICAIFNERAGWHFNCQEHESSSGAVKSCLADTEALAYRHKDHPGTHGNRHEFPAMVKKLLEKLGAGTQ